MKSKAKKFIAILGEEDLGDGTSSFYIVDEGFYKKNGYVSSDAEYMPEVYDSIEQLGRGCTLAAENFFTVEGVMRGGEDGLRKFLKPLNWIVVESDYLKGAQIQEFKNTSKHLDQEIKKLNSPNIVFINDLKDKYLENIIVKLNNKSSSICTNNDIKGCLSWLEKQLNKDKVIAIDKDDLYYCYTFDNMESYLQNVNKAKAFKKALMPNEDLPENAPNSVKIAHELKIPYLISESEQELDNWENTAKQIRMDVMRGQGIIFAFDNNWFEKEFTSRLLKLKKGDFLTYIKRNAEKLNIPYYICKSEEDIDRMKAQIMKQGEPMKKVVQIGNAFFVIKDEKELEKLRIYTILDEVEPSNEDEKN